MGQPRALKAASPRFTDRLSVLSPMSRASRLAKIDHRMEAEGPRQISRVVRSLSRRRRLLGPAALCVIVFVVGCAGRSPVGISTFVLLAGLLAVTVRIQWSVRAETRHPAVLRTPTQLALGVCLVVAGGGLLAVLVALALSAVAPAFVGDGNLVIRLLLALFAIGPCMSIGFRFGRWWTFLGALTLIPLVGFAMLVGSGASSGLGLSAVAVSASAFALAAGALNAQLAYEDSSRARRRRR